MVPARRSSTRSIPWPNGPAPYNRRAENISMAHHLDLEEQEQLDRLKHFWRAWGTPITSVLIVGAGAIAGWNGYQYWQNRQAAQAAALWDVADMAVRAGDQARMEQAFGDLKAKYPGTAQAAQAGLALAKALQDAGKTDGAKQALGGVAQQAADEGLKGLGWVAQQWADEGLKALARLRLSSLLMDQKNHEEALQQLSGSFAPAFAAIVADRK